MFCDLHRIALAQHDDRRGVRSGRLDGLRRLTSDSPFGRPPGLPDLPGRNSVLDLGIPHGSCSQDNGLPSWMDVNVFDTDNLLPAFTAPAIQRRDQLDECGLQLHHSIPIDLDTQPAASRREGPSLPPSLPAI
jgi:hypothetical protein